MEPIIPPVDRSLILAELTEEKLLRKTNNGNNEIYVVTAQNSPNIMQELGRLRELSFRDAGGGTGAAVDIDDEDLAEEGYQQLFVWDPKAQEIFNQEGQGAGEGEICQQQNSRNGNGGGKLAGMMQYLSNHHHEKPSFQTKRSSVKSGR